MTVFSRTSHIGKTEIKKPIRGLTEITVTDLHHLIKNGQEVMVIPVYSGTSLWENFRANFSIIKL